MDRFDLTTTLGLTAPLQTLVSDRAAGLALPRAYTTVFPSLAAIGNPDTGVSYAVAGDGNVAWAGALNWLHLDGSAT